MPTLVSKCFVVKNAENVLLWTAVSLLFSFTKTNPNGISLSCGVSPKEITAKINVNERNVFKCVINYWLVWKLRSITNEVEMDVKYTPYNHKGTKIDGVEQNIVEHLLQKEDCLISKYVSSLQYRDLVIQLPEH